MRDSVVDARGTDQLADDDTLGTVNDKSAGLRHERKIAHEDLMLADLIVFLVVKTHLHAQRRRICGIPLRTLLDRILDILVIVFIIRKLKAEFAAVVLNRRNVVEYFPETMLQEPPVGVLLNFDQVRHLQDFLLALEAHTETFTGFNRTDPVFFH